MIYYAKVKKTGEPVEVVRELKAFHGSPPEVQTSDSSVYKSRELKRISKDEFYRLDDLAFMDEVS